MKLFAKILLGASALLNLALAVVLLSGTWSNRPAAVTPSPVDAAQAAAADARAQTAAMWSTLQTDDLPALIAHLRSAGFPPNMIRAIIAAQLREQFAARRKAIEGTPNQAYWKNATFDPKQQQALRELSREQDKILRDLLGPDADANDGWNLAYRDRGLSGLPAAKADQIRQILRDFDQQRQDLYSSIAMGGGMISFGPADRDKMKAIDSAQRAEIAKVLTPAELENYELMASNTAQSLRYQLSAFNATEDEFRALYKLQQDFEDKVGGQMYGMPSPEQMRARSDAQKQLNQQIELALGTQRYADYQRATDYNYRQTTLLVARMELPPDTANQLYTIQKDYQQRAMETRMNAMSSGGDTAQELTALQQEAIAKVTPILGSDKAVDAYKQYGGNWITNMVPRAPMRSAAGAAGTAAPAPKT